MRPETLERVCFAVSCVAFGASAILCALKFWDVMLRKWSRQNGPMLYMASDKLRRQVFTVAVAAYALSTSVSSVNNTEPVSTQAKNLLSFLLFYGLATATESLFIFRRRRKLPRIIADYEGKPGGMRFTDPPA